MSGVRFGVQGIAIYILGMCCDAGSKGFSFREVVRQIVDSELGLPVFDYSGCGVHRYCGRFAFWGLLGSRGVGSMNFV